MQTENKPTQGDIHFESVIIWPDICNLNTIRDAKIQQPKQMVAATLKTNAVYVTLAQS